MTKKKMSKRPESVLVLVYTNKLEVLLLKKNGYKDMWQSVTGSLFEHEDAYTAAKRELLEETGIKGDPKNLNTSSSFEIYQMWIDKYEKGVTHNLEHVFEYKLEDKIDIKLDKNEHNEYLWLTRVKAAEKVFSHTNRQAIFDFVK